MMRLRIFSVLFLLLSSIGCLSVRDLSSSNLSSLYRTEERTFHCEFMAFNETDTTIRIFIKLLPSEFLYSRQSDDKFRSVANILSEVLISYEDAKVVDSASKSFSFDMNERDGYRIVEMTVPAPINNKYMVRCTITDSTKGTDDYYMIPVDRFSKPSRQDFLVCDSKGNPVFKYYLASNDTVSVKYKNDSIKQFGCKFYYRDFPLASPPFSFDMHDDFNYRPDSFFFVSSEQLLKLNLPAQGFYHIQTDTSNKDGLTLFRFINNFPDVTTPRQMIEAIRYLTNKKEYEEMRDGENLKSQIDNFWLTRGGNEEKTRLLIKKYYGRVREANKYFTSHTEGWRTDRGMIYVIFGSPGTVYKSNESESWTYGTPTNSLALNFFFIKVNNPFTENDFTLSRSPTYEGSWYRAVEVWRQGRAYNSFN